MAERGRPRKFDRTEALRGAMRTFWELGYEGASITDLAAAMGINSASVYNTFGSKEDLFREAITLYVRDDGSAPYRVLLEAPTAREAIEGMLRGNLELFAESGTPTGCMVVLSATNYSPRNQVVRDHVVDYRRNTVLDMEKRLRRAVDEGELSASVDVGVVASFYGTVLHGLSIEARDGVSPARLQSTVDMAMSLWGSFDRG
ncbi:MAG: TetR/AcrR family transcriptional regulator [Kibdelosporangium sp.]